MYQLKQAPHRFVADGVGSNVRTCSRLGTIGSMHHTVMGIAPTSTGHGIFVAMDNLPAKNVVASYSLTLSGLVSGNISAFGASVASTGSPTQIDNSEYAVPLPFDIVTSSDDRSTITLTGNVVVPVLDLEDGETQYFAVCVAASNVEGYIGGQVTIYEKELDFWQPTK